MQLLYTYPKDTKSFGYFIILALLWFCSPLCAQTVSPVSKDYLIEFYKNKKPFSHIQTVENLSKKIDYKPKFIKVNYQAPLLFDIKPMRTRQLASPKFRSNYISAGIGNYQSSYIEAFLNTKRQEKHTCSLYIRHLASRFGVIDRRNSGNANNEILFNFQSLTKKGTWSGKAGFEQQKWHFYGYKPFEPSVPKTKEIEQRFNIVHGELGYANKYNQNKYTYAVGVFYQYLADSYAAKELEIGGKFESKMRFNPNSNLFFNTQLSSSERWDLAGKLHRDLLVSELYHQWSNAKVNIQIGGRAALHNDTIQNRKAIYFYPKLNFSLNVLKNSVNVYAQLEGNMQKRLLRTMLAENPFLAQNIALTHTNKVWEASAGFRTQLGGMFNWQTKLSYGIYQNLYFFMNSPALPSRFAVQYEAASIPVSTFTNEFTFHFKKLKAKLQTSLFNYETQTIAQAWHRPRLTNTLSVSYVANKYSFELDFYHLAGIAALDVVQSKQLDLQLITDLNLKINYELSPHWSLFLRGSNLLAQQYQRYLYYEVRTAQVMGGATFAF